MGEADHAADECVLSTEDIQSRTVVDASRSVRPCRDGITSVPMAHK